MEIKINECYEIEVTKGQKTMIFHASAISKIEIVERGLEIGLHEHEHRLLLDIWLKVIDHY